METESGKMVTAMTVPEAFQAARLQINHALQVGKLNAEVTAFYQELVNQFEQMATTREHGLACGRHPAVRELRVHRLGAG
jgi:hypothetical protein